MQMIKFSPQKLIKISTDEKKVLKSSKFMLRKREKKMLYAAQQAEKNPERERKVEQKQKKC
jgi:hypothetical protein